MEEKAQGQVMNCESRALLADPGVGERSRDLAGSAPRPGAPGQGRGARGSGQWAGGVLTWRSLHNAKPARPRPLGGTHPPPGAGAGAEVVSCRPASSRAGRALRAPAPRLTWDGPPASRGSVPGALHPNSNPATLPDSKSKKQIEGTNEGEAQV